MQQRTVVTPKSERIQAAAEFLQSGKTMSVWSQERQINRYTLSNWVGEFRREKKPVAQNCGWLEVSVNAGADKISTEKKDAYKTAATAYTPIRISIGNTQIEVTTAFDESALAAVIKAVSCQC